MSSIKRVLLEEVPTQLTYKTQCFVEDGDGGFDSYIGDSNNEPVLTGRPAQDIPSAYGSESVDNSDSPYTISVLGEHTVLLVDATDGVTTATLPAASDFEDQTITVKKVDSSANAVTVEGDGAEEFDGVASQDLSDQYNWVTVYSDGTSIHITSEG